MVENKASNCNQNAREDCTSETHTCCAKEEGTRSFHNADLHLWYVYLEGVEGRHKASHSKSVHFSSEKMDKFTDLEAGRSSSVLETTVMMAENESGSPLGKAEANGECETPVDSLSTEVAGTSNDSLTPLVSCVSPVRISEKPDDILSESNKNSKKSASKISSVTTRRKFELEAVLLEEQAQADVFALEEK